MRPDEPVDPTRPRPEHDSATGGRRWGRDPDVVDDDSGGQIESDEVVDLTDGGRWGRNSDAPAGPESDDDARWGKRRRRPMRR